MILEEETDAFRMGISSVKVTLLNPNTARHIAERLGGDTTEAIVTERLGVRKTGLQGVVTRRFVCFGSYALEIAWVDEMGGRNGDMGIIFFGEYEMIPDIFVHS